MTTTLAAVLPGPGAPIELRDIPAARSVVKALVDPA